MGGETFIDVGKKSALTETAFERLDTMPDCPYATDDCFCVQRFIWGFMDKVKDRISSDRERPKCPENAIVETDRGTVYRVNSVFSTRHEPSVSLPHHQ